MSDELAAHSTDRFTLTRDQALRVPVFRPAIIWPAIRRLLLAMLALYATAFTVRAALRDYFVFLPDYVRWMFHGTVGASPHAGPTHLFVLMTDHFEPDRDPARVRDWLQRYELMADRHRDHARRRPQHTFFYPAEQYSPEIYSDLRTMAAGGYGEVELHFHHDHDTFESLQASMRTAIEQMTQYGFLRTVDGKTQFAFVHGNSGLDNSNGPEMCGVSREIQLLRELGCFADFTFPSIFEPAQPATVNSIYATRDDDRPKSYDTRLPLSTLTNGTADLMIFQGPLIFTPTLNARQLFLHLDDGDVHAAEHARPSRVDAWVRANVHVPERPDWVFIKLFTHGASTPGDIDAVVGNDFDDALTYLETHYNDGVQYVLHYITAREAYNLARAAAEGAQGDPQAYLDAYIRPYVANAGSPAPRSSSGAGTPE